MSTNRVIGRDGDLPWSLPDDMKWFMAKTTGHAIIMGRGNWQAMNAKPLPARRNIVLTRRAGYDAPGAEVVATLDEALALAGEDDEPFIIGGGEVYRLALDAGVVDRMYLTRVHADVEGDTYFPPFDPAEWRETARTEHGIDEKHVYPFSIITYDKIKPAQAPDDPAENAGR